MILRSALLGVALLVFVAAANGQSFGRPCTGYEQSEIYCYGDLLRTIQKAELYEDQKFFVDLALKYEPDIVLGKFRDLNIIGDDLSPEQRSEIRRFVEGNFVNASEFEDWIPSDWAPNPEFLSGIEDEHLRIFASELHDFWHVLGKKIRVDVKENSTLYSMYYVSHPVIVPGGRFTEFYYWDSYWIQRGLLISNMTATVKGMIENFMEMVNLLGFIPNGGRIYYQRSQPPYLAQMVDGYFEKTGDLDFLRDNFNTLKKEYFFFHDNRTVDVSVNGKVHKMAHFNVELTEPRPESFSDDYDLVEPLNISRAEKDLVYANLKTGAESGFDFSSRWFVIPEDESLIDATLADTKTRNIIPVDLNTLLFKHAQLLAKFCLLINDQSVCNPNEYLDEAERWKTAIHDVLWDEEIGTWFDYDFVLGKKRKMFFPTNLTPLWLHAHHGDIRSIARRSVNYLHLSGATNFPGGIPTSMLHTGQQWDFPNGWAPLNHIVVEALERSGEETAMELAFKLAEKWVQSNHVAYLKENNMMFEKYDVSVFGSAGGGGEYDVVPGFGWTNGVVLDFLEKYGKRMKAAEQLPERTTPEPMELINNGKLFIVD